MKVAIVGLGRLGSLLSFLVLERFRVDEVYLIDFDVVEERNVTSQVPYEREHVGLKKALVLSEILRKKFDVWIKPIPERIEEVSLDVDLVIDCVDEMETKFYISEKFDLVLHGSVNSGRGFVYFKKNHPSLGELVYYSSREPEDVGLWQVSVVAGVMVKVLEDVLSKTNPRSRFVYLDLLELKLEEFELE
jgi:hypothetical protein